MQIVACRAAGIAATLPKPQTSGSKSEGHFGKQDFARGGRLSLSSWGAIAVSLYKPEDGKMLRRYWTTTIKIVRSTRNARQARMGATHFLTKSLPTVAAEMALSVAIYNLTWVMKIVGNKPLMAAIVA